MPRTECSVVAGFSVLAGRASFALSTSRKPIGRTGSRTLMGLPAWQTGLMDRRKWFDSSQPQTLQIAVILLYINAVFAVIYALGSQVFFLPMILEGAAAYGIANERRFGYIGAIILSGLFAFGAVALFVYYGGIGTLLNVVFSIALFVALVHPMSREYQRIWFK